MVRLVYGFAPWLGASVVASSRLATTAPITLYRAAAVSRDTALHPDILRLYVQMADARRLDLPKRRRASQAA